MTPRFSASRLESSGISRHSQLKLRLIISAVYSGIGKAIRQERKLTATGEFAWSGVAFVSVAKRPCVGGVRVDKDRAGQGGCVGSAERTCARVLLAKIQGDLRRTAHFWLVQNQILSRARRGALLGFCNFEASRVELKPFAVSYR